MFVTQNYKTITFSNREISQLILALDAHIAALSSRVVATEPWTEEEREVVDFFLALQLESAKSALKAVWE
jgi:hypothetical protein